MKTKINWKEQTGKTLFVNFSELSKEVQKSIITENAEYLKWVDDSKISKAALQDFMLLKHETGVYSLTMKDQDFYVNDIIFTE